jgi:bifunctional polynucleotide phosphatase/kinase
MFAHNCGLKFYTPEEFFLNHKPISKFEWGSINPKEFLDGLKPPTEQKHYYTAEPEIVLLIGPPASGKTTFFRQHLQAHNYVHVNRDTLQTMAKCIQVGALPLRSRCPISRLICFERRQMMP